MKGGVYRMLTKNQIYTNIFHSTQTGTLKSPSIQKEQLPARFSLIDVQAPTAPKDIY